MSTGEFDLIKRYFSAPDSMRSDVLLGIGDDAAILSLPANTQLAVTTDTLVAGNHFLASVNPAWVANKAVVANISDLAAMGAVPAWCSLALTLPEYNATWLSGFSQGLFAAMKPFAIALIGGDTTKGALAISITLQGYIEAKKALTRRGAKAGDLIYVSGELGDSAAGLHYILQQQSEQSATLSANAKQLIYRHYHKSPQVALGLALRDVASACVDISDGLCADLGHILAASQVGAVIDADKLPLSAALLTDTQSKEKAAKIALTSGEEYELCFCAPAEKHAQLAMIAKQTGVQLSCIGQITARTELITRWQGQAVNWQQQGWDHFRA